MAPSSQGTEPAQYPGRFNLTGEIPEFHDTVNAIIEWSDEILDWHHTGQPSNGRIEGTNNLLQVLRRTAHGFTNPANFQARGLLIT
ncbi:transposase [Candidatus Poriferisocius sp.]|uniref:transposase n=1 Tax=Candidatus Poriferisocius sp. TaxID=3101276 RepID=UPI003B5C2FCF